MMIRIQHLKISHKKDFILCIVFPLVLFSLCTFLQWNRFLPEFLGDELAYILPAKTMATGASYSFSGYWGSSLIYVPVSFFISDPVALYRSMLFIQTIMIVLNFFVLKTIINRFFGLKKTFCSIIAFIASFYPSIMFYSIYVMSETTLLLFFNLTILFMYNLFTKNKIIDAVLLGLCSVYLYFIHSRALPLTGTVCLILLFYFIFHKTNGKFSFKANSKFLLPILIIGILYFTLGNQKTSGSNGGLFEQFFTKLEMLIPAHYLANLSGSWIYLFLGSFGIAICGIIFSIIYLWKNRNRQHTSIFYVLLFACVGYLLFLLVMLLSFSNYNMDYSRLDHVFYGRYTEFIFPLFICIGLAQLFKKDSSEYFPRKKVYIASILFFALCFIALYIFGGNIASLTVNNINNVSAISTFVQYIYTIPREPLYLITFLIGSGIFSIFFFLPTLKKNNIGLYIFIILFCGISFWRIYSCAKPRMQSGGFEEKQYSVAVDAKEYNHMNIGEYFSANIDQKTYSENIIPITSSIYLYNVDMFHVNEFSNDFTISEYVPFTSKRSDIKQTDYWISSSNLLNVLPLFGNTIQPFEWYYPINLYYLPYTNNNFVEIKGLNEDNQMIGSTAEFTNLSYKNDSSYFVLDTKFSSGSEIIPQINVNGESLRFDQKIDYLYYYDLDDITTIDNVTISIPPSAGETIFFVNTFYTTDEITAPLYTDYNLYQLGTSLSFTFPGYEIREYAPNGWLPYTGLSTPQDWGTWVNGDKASFMFSFNEKDVASDLVLDIDYVPYLSDTCSEQIYEIYVNGRLLHTASAKSSEVSHMSVLIPSELLGCRSAQVTIKNPTAQTISGAEGFTTGIGLINLSISAAK